MTFRGYRLHVIIVTCVILVAVGLSVKQLVYSQRVVGPLERDFASIDGVAEAALEQRGDYMDVILTLEPVYDLPRLYKEAEALRDDRLGSAAGRIVLKDRRNEALTASYERIHFAVQEGAVTGRFTQMATIIDEMVATLPVDDVRVSVDERFIYVQLVAGDGYLYEIVPRAYRIIGDRLEGDLRR